MECWNCNRKINVGKMIHEVPFEYMNIDSNPNNGEMVHLCDHCYKLIVRSY